MAYRRQYSRRYTRRSAGMDRALDHIRAYEELNRRLGPIVSDVKDAFLHLHGPDLLALLADYERLYGKKAAQYARETYYSWRDGSRKMSGQTAERILNLVPPYLNFEQRFKMVSRLCEFHTEKRTATVLIDTSNPTPGFCELQGLIDSFADIGSIKHIPEHVLSVAVWLNDDDVTAARGMLAQIDQARISQIKTAAKRDMESLYSIAQDENTRIARHRIEFPNGCINVELVKPRKSFLAWLFGD